LKRLEPTLNDKLITLTTHFKEDVFSIVLEDGMMMPTKQQLQAIGIISEG
jgi:hypothetical protein